MLEVIIYLTKLVKTNLACQWTPADVKLPAKLSEYRQLRSLSLSASATAPLFQKKRHQRCFPSISQTLQNSPECNATANWVCVYVRQTVPLQWRRKYKMLRVTFAKLWRHSAWRQHLTCITDVGLRLCLASRHFMHHSHRLRVAFDTGLRHSLGTAALRNSHTSCTGGYLFAHLKLWFLSINAPVLQYQHFLTKFTYQLKTSDKTI